MIFLILLLLLFPANLSAKPAETFSQSIQIHEGWNLVSWHIVPVDEYGPTLQMFEILPGPPSWLTDNNGKVFTWESNLEYYPDHPPGSASWEWDLDYAYYFEMDGSATWQFTNRPHLTVGPVTDIDPNVAWDSNRLDPYNMATEWFFLGYSTPGYMKLASIPNAEQTTSGNPGFFDYEGPLHWLIWHNQSPDYPQYDLKVIRSDEGRFYIPTPANPDNIVDEIGVLEPGRGYFLGFAADENETYDFEGWPAEPVWRNEWLPPNPKESQSQLASGSHFQFNKYTHWAYPVLIDTVDLGLTPLEPGDEIAVFDGDLCVGASAYPDSFPVLITCWEDDIATPVDLDGYIWNSPMTFIWYDASENTEADFVVPPTIQASKDDPVAPRCSGFGRGFYALRSFSDGIHSVTQLPKAFRVSQNYPNPFNASTVFPLELPQRSRVRIDIFDVSGRKVWTVSAGVQNAGWPKIPYNASRLSSGVYFYRVTAEGLERGGTYQDVGKMLLLK
jgi:hypothetical protein